MAEDVLVYEATGIGSDQFGVLDLNTGVFTSRGGMGLTLAGLGEYGGQIYGGSYHGNTLYSVNTTTGALTDIGTGNVGGGYGDFGSTTSGLYAFGGDGNLYSINPASAAATLIGPTGLSFGGIVMGMSSGSSSLYLTQNDLLYSLNTTTGAATLIGNANVNEAGFGALVSIGGTLYGGAASTSNPPDIYTLDPQNGAATFLVSSPSTPYTHSVAGFWGLAPIDDDANEQAALSLTVNGGAPIGALIAGAVPFTVNGIEADDSGTVSFSDGKHAPVVVNIVNGVPAAAVANLAGLSDSPITATLHLNNDAAGNSFTDVVVSATLDQDTNDQPAVTLAGLTGGNAVEGMTVTATVTADDLPSSGITYAWQVSHDGGTTWTPISGATSNSYMPTEPDEGGQLQAQVSFTDLAGNNETGTATVLNVVDVPPTLSVTLSGIAQEGQTLTATPTLGTDGDNTTADVTYQWERNRTPIGGATGSTYVVAEADEGASIQVVASFTNDTGQSVQATSTPTGIVIDAPPTLSVSIGGSAKDGQTLTAIAVANDSDASITYQWQSLTGTKWTNISGATSSTYVVTEADEGQRLRVVGISTDTDGGGTKATSSATAKVTDSPPELTIASNSLTVAAGGSVAMGIGVSIPDADDTVSVKIAGLRAYESITDSLDGQVFNGGAGAVMLTGDEVNSGLTLHSTYHGTGQPVNTLKVTASNTAEAVSSAAQTITVTDPPATPGEKIALLVQYMASSFSASSYGYGEAVVTDQSLTGSARSEFLASPHT
jgi:hypothetical protein